mgnify:CR=1 FL=1
MRINYFFMGQHKRLRGKFRMATLERNWARLQVALEKRAMGKKAPDDAGLSREHQPD